MKVAEYIRKEHGITALFFVLVVMRAGYFYFESMAYLAIASVIFLALSFRLIWQKKYFGQELILPFLFLAFYTLPIFWSGKMHLYGIFKMATPLILALALVQLEKPFKLMEKVMTAYALTLVLAFAFLGLQQLLIRLNINQESVSYLFMPMVIKQRFTGFVQYANTNALLSLLAGLTAVFYSRNKWLAAICAVSIGFSGSRTIWLITLVAVFVMRFWGIDWKDFFAPISKRKDLAKEIALIFFMMAFLISLVLSSRILGGNRISDGLNASELQTRFLYYKDGINLLLSNPWGLGHYGYHLVQRQFQTGSTYFIKYIHQFILQIALDGGVMSAVLFVGLLLFTGLKMLSQWKKSAPVEKGLFFFLMIGFGHSMLDFNLEFSLILLLWWLCYFYTESSKPAEANALQKRLVGGAALVLICSALYTGMLSVMTLYGREEFPARQDFVDAQTKLIRNEQKDIDLRLETAKNMLRQPIKNVETFAFLRNYYYNKGMMEQAIDYGREAVRLAPLWIEHRQELMRIEYAYTLQNINNAEKVADDILNTPAVLKKLQEERATDRNVKHKPQWEMTEEMKKWYHHFEILYSFQKEKL